MGKKRLIINLVSSIFAFAVQMGISFVLTPKIVEQLGEEAYGFIGLANNFISYATIVTVALNSMSSRYITIEMHKGNNDKANEYYSSTFVANLILSVIILILSIFMIINLVHIVNIPDGLVVDVQITFSLASVNFMITLLTTVFNVATFAKNRLDLASIRNIIANILKSILLIVLFALLKPKIYYISIATILYTLYVAIENMRITKRIAPELKVKFKQFKTKAVKTLITSGIWNSINSLSRILLTGLDLLIANLLVSPYSMGLLSIAKTIPTAIESLLATIGNVFTPQFTILYSQNKIDELVKEAKFSIKLLSLIMTVPIAGIIVFGTSFFSLWLKSKNSEEIMQIQILSVLSLLPYVLSAYIYTLSSLDTVTNKLKRPVIASLIMSIVSTVTVFIVLKTTNLGIYAVAGVSSLYWVIKILVFNPINAAYNLKIKLNTFYPPFFKAIACLLIIIAMFCIVNRFILIDSWFKLIALSIFVGTLGYIINYCVLLNREEKNKVKSMALKFMRLKNV